MPRILLILVFASLALFLAACGDDDDADSPSGSPTPSASSTGGVGGVPGGSNSPTAEVSETAVDTSDPGKTPDPSATEGATVAPATAPGEVPTPGPTAADGTAAIEVSDASLFITQFLDREIVYVVCAYNPSTALTNCPGNGLFAIDPPIVGQDIQCTLWVVEQIRQAIQCTVVEPAQSRYFDIQ